MTTVVVPQGLHQATAEAGNVKWTLLALSCHCICCGPFSAAGQLLQHQTSSHTQQSAASILTRSQYACIHWHGHVAAVPKPGIAVTRSVTQQRFHAGDMLGNSIPDSVSQGLSLLVKIPPLTEGGDN